MKHILRKLTTLFMVMAVLISGCGKEKDTANNNLNFEKQTLEETTIIMNSYEDYNAIASENEGWIDPDLDLKKALEEGEEIYSFRNQVTYNGEKLNCRYYCNNTSALAIKKTIFVTANGNIQPFCVDDGKEMDSYTVALKPGEEKDVHITFDPIYAPVGEEGITKVYCYSYPEKNEELISVMEKNKSDYAAPYTQFSRIRYEEVGIQADSAKNERKISPSKNEIGEDSKNIFTDESTGKPLDNTSGVTFGKKFIEKGHNGFIELNVDWNRKEPLYARASCYGERDVRIFLLVDGEIVPAFQGKYYADYHSKTGTVHNIPLDTEALPKDGEHIIIGLIDYLNTGETDCIYPILLHVQ